MKIISENTKPDYARVICVFFSFAGFAGPLTASLIAMIFNWNAAFLFAGTVSAAIGICAYAAISVLEKKGMITFKKMKEITFSEMLAVFKINRFPFFLTIACLVEIAGMSISFWIPTFLNEYINLPASESNLVFSFISLVRALIPFATLALFKLFGGRDTLIMKYAYGISFAAFLCMLFVPKGILTVAFLLLALIMNSFVSAMLWSIYIPALGETGRVSSISTSLFAWVVSSFSWSGLIVSWSIIPVIGIAATFLLNRKAA